MKDHCFVGTCADSFDPSTGECRFYNFVDVSDFAVADEAAQEIDEREPLSACWPVALPWWIGRN